MIHQKTFKNLVNAKIYLVGTPIGNLDDFSIRGVKMLQEVDLIFCEDTRTSQVLLNHYKIKNKLLSLHKFNEVERLSLLKPLLKQGKRIAIISDAGVPAISDPGAIIINKVRNLFPNTVDVTAIGAGPAYVCALITTGFVSAKHYFFGFLTNKTSLGKKQELITNINKYHQDAIIIFYESIHRIKSTIAILQEILSPTTLVSVARELTKINEEILQGTIKEIASFVASTNFIAKGEVVVIIDKQPKGPQNQQSWTVEAILKQVNEYLQQGFKLPIACQVVGDLVGKNKNDIYQIYLKAKTNS